MARMTGLQVALELSKQNRPAIVFVTAYRQFAVDAFTAEALDYLLKPIDDDRFNVCLDKVRAYASHRLQPTKEGAQRGSAEQLCNSENSCPLQRVAIKDGRRIHLIDCSDIDWIEGAGDYVNIHSRGTCYLLRETLSALERQLGPETLLPCTPLSNRQSHCGARDPLTAQSGFDRKIGQRRGDPC